MLSFSLEEILPALRGSLLQGERGLQCNGVATDTRTIRPGELFIALQGERFDGHNFLAAAAAAGATAAVVMANVLPSGGFPPGMAIIEVADSLTALADIARWHRQRFPIPVVAITGSNGKTTTKDLAAAILTQQKKVVKTAANFNNEIGLPLTLLQIDAATEVAVVEMGMRGLGQIKALAAVALPTIGIVTNVGLTHLEILGSQENIARAKTELIQALPDGGLAILNGDDSQVREMQPGAGVRSVFYGIDGRNLDYRATGIRHSQNGTAFTVEAKNAAIPVRLPLPGQHNVYNALAAIALALELGIDQESIRAGLARPELTGRRLKMIAAQGFYIIDDTYNASPTSVKAALEVLRQSGPGRKIAVLADMLELGPEAADYHRQIGEYAAELGIDHLFALGDLARDYVSGINRSCFNKGEYFGDKSQLLQRLQEYLQPGDHILVKGSRSMKMEEIVAALTGEGDAP